MMPVPCCQSLMSAVIKRNPIYFYYRKEKSHESCVQQKQHENIKLNNRANPFSLTDIFSSESCMGRCENGFDSRRRCQCDSMCKYYKSCCSDYEVTCGMTSKKPSVIMF